MEDLREKLLKPGMTCLGLRAAPGAWSQYVRRRLGRGGRVVATDILPRDPLEGVEFVQGDFREHYLTESWRYSRNGRWTSCFPIWRPHWAASMWSISPRSMYLAELAVDMAAKVLKGGGGALIKVFQGAGFQELIQQAPGRFAQVKLVKPAASRARSPEMYLLAKDFRLV